MHRHAYTHRHADTHAYTHMCTNTHALTCMQPCSHTNMDTCVHVTLPRRPVCRSPRDAPADAVFSPVPVAPVQFVDIQPNDGFGTILPLETVELDLIFQPTKAKEYNFELVCKSEINR